nr:PREDICTED: synaptotagmin-like protein 1 [Latimeria chalumnae]|eukprot:XP_005991109.1 PREDICTED: synaptotagmin-like protein 1 [Latimeria chalumnae]
MTQEIDADALLDLSFLTEEEQNAIVQVLTRDAQLKAQEEGRINKLRESISDPSQLKVLTGDWFSEVRSKRHRDLHFGTDIVRASIRKKKKSKGEKGSKDVVEMQATGDEEANLEEANLKELGTSAKTEANGFEEDDMSLNPCKIQVINSSVENLQEETNGSPENGTEEEPIRLNGITPSIPSISIQDVENELTVESDNHFTPPKTQLENSSSMSNLLSSTTLSGSMMSLYSNVDFGNIEVKGHIQFSLQYDEKKKEFRIYVVQCRYLAEAKKQRSDPYVKSYLLPDKSSQSKRKTSVIKKNLNPVFNETFKYKIEKSELLSRTLNLSVWHNDRLGRNVFLGEVETSLASWDWSKSEASWFNLQHRTPVSSEELLSRGKLALSLKYVPPEADGNHSSIVE